MPLCSVPASGSVSNPVNGLRPIHITSINELRAAAAPWDDLWWRSDVALPTYRAELVAQWVEQFAPNARFHALVVEDHGQWVAALPLVHRRLGRLLDAGVMPANEWSSRGELLLDRAADVDAVLDVLVGAMRDLPWQLLRLDEAPLQTSRFRSLGRAIDRAAMASHRHALFQVGLIDTGGDWQQFRAAWSRKHRQQMARHFRRLAKQGNLSFRTHAQLDPQQIEVWMRRGLEVEDRSWKGRTGTSVLRTPGMFQFFLRQARQLARWEQVQLSFLELDRRPIAFAYGIAAKGVYHSCKRGYDARYAAYSPGQLLGYRMLEAFHADPECRAVDCLGPITDAHRKWKPSPYTLGRIVVAPGRMLGRMALCAYKRLRPKLRRLRGAPPAEAVVDPAAEAVVGPVAEAVAGPVAEDAHCRIFTEKSGLSRCR